MLMVRLIWQNDINEMFSHSTEQFFEIFWSEKKDLTSKLDGRLPNITMLPDKEGNSHLN